MMQERFQLAQVAEIIDTSPQTIKGWLHRDLVVGHAAMVEGGADTGRRRSFSVHALMQMAVIKALLDIGLRNDALARDASTVFAHLGKSSAGWVGEPMELRGQRLPGLPFHPSIGRTFIEVTMDGARVKKESELRSVLQAASVLVNVSLMSVICIPPTW